MTHHKQVFIKLVKYIPVVQMVGTLIRSALQVTNHIVLEYILDCLCGTTVFGFIIIMYCSHIFKFCNTHKLLILCNFINSIIINSTNAINVFGTTINLSLISHLVCNAVLIVFLYKTFLIKEDYEAKNEIIEGLIAESH